MTRAFDLSNIGALQVLGEPIAAPAPLVQVVQARGAVLEWLVDGSRFPTVTVTDPAACDWLWRLIGERAHAAVLASAVPEGASPVPVDVDWDLELLGGLRRMAHGHWLRAWWPASPIDGVAPLDVVLLPAELAVAAAELDDVLADGADAVDGPELSGLRRHAGGLRGRAGSVEPEVRDLAVSALELIGEPAPERAGACRDEYALVAGGRAGADDDAIAAGTVAHCWQGVPAGTIDASENAVAWSLDAAGAVELTVRAALVGGDGAAGIPVRAAVGGVAVAGELEADGTAVLPVGIGAADAWALDAGDIDVEIGHVPGAPETRETRDSVRDFAARRLRFARGGEVAAAAGGAYVVEKLAARMSR